MDALLAALHVGRVLHPSGGAVPENNCNGAVLAKNPLPTIIVMAG
jgi:hypothetical protein